MQNISRSHAVRLLGLAATLSVLAICAEAAAQNVDGRAAVQEIAAVIDQNYFDVAKAAEISRTLRDEAMSGTFDSFAEPDDLATELNRRLKPLDGHFGVAWTIKAAPIPAPEQIAYEDQVRRINFGFRRVEILPGNIGYIDLRFFPDFDFDDAAAPERRAADAALQTLANTDAVIIDVTENGGGSPEMAAYLASAFLPLDSNAYMVERDRSGRTTSHRPSTPYGALRIVSPVIVMISARTASAAEAFPYMLQAAHRATIVGQASMGAASLARPMPTTSGYTVFVPYAVTTSPLTNDNWEGSGVQPDVAGPVADAKNHAWIFALQMLLEKDMAPAIASENRWILETLLASPLSIPLGEYDGIYGDTSVRSQDEHLVYRKGLRPPWVLRPISMDLFTVVSEPTQRIRFNRDEEGRVSGLNILWSEGSISPTERRVPPEFN